MFKPRRIIAHSTIHDELTGITVVISPQVSLIAIIVLGIWLLGWTTGGILAINKVYHHGISKFLFFWLLVWAFAEKQALVGWLWGIGGKEIIIVKPRVFTIRHEIFKYGKSKEYNLKQICNLKYSEFNPFDHVFNFSLMFKPKYISHGNMTCVYNGQTLRFGVGVGEVEGKEIVQTINQRYNI